jgi:23S rRNA maturation-related 3'-5' exoribonuclease YhaM
VVVAGAILHDIGKLRELSVSTSGARYSPLGELIGHVLLGRDMVREAAAGKLQTMLQAIEDDAGDDPFTTSKNPLRYKIFKGL